MTANEAGVKVGDYFRCSWGYDQTNIEFYKVVKTTAKGVYVAAVPSRMAADGRHVVPASEPNHGARVRFHRIAAGYGRPAFTVNSYSAAYLWDGTPQYDTIKAGEAGH